MLLGASPRTRLVCDDASAERGRGAEERERFHGEAELAVEIAVLSPSPLRRLAARRVLQNFLLHAKMPTRSKPPPKVPKVEILSSDDDSAEEWEARDDGGFVLLMGVV